jgi:parallel beta-helix repeat protein
MAATNMSSVICRSASVIVLAIASMSAVATSGLLEITADTNLREDHVGPIAFVADHVTLNCHGRQVSAPGEAQAILIQGRTGVTVKNCVVTAAVRGLSVESSQDVVIKHNSAIGNQNTGMFFHNSDNLSIAHNSVASNGVAGMDIQFVTNSTVHLNTSYANAIYGFLILVADNNVFRQNTAADNTRFGFILFSSSGNLMQKNSACGHGVDLLLDTIVPGENVFRQNAFCVVEQQIS